MKGGFTFTDRSYFPVRLWNKNEFLMSFNNVDVFFPICWRVMHNHYCRKIYFVDFVKTQRESLMQYDLLNFKSPLINWQFYQVM